MKKTAIILISALTASLVSAESIMKPINDKGYGTISGRVQSLSMYRDFENNASGVNGANSTLGIIFGYTSPELAGFDAGLAYNYAGEIYQNNNSPLMANEEIHLLNEGWLRFNFGAMNLTNTSVLAGRKINNGEVFRADDFRQKSRAIETVQLDTKDLSNTTLTVGHAIRMSNWIQVGDRWDFNDFGDVFGRNYNDSDGVTWGELVNTCVQGLEVALFDAYAWDVANLVGTRVKYETCETASLIGYYRHEGEVGNAVEQNSDAFGLSLQQKVGTVTIEPGYFGVRGNNLLFEETTTGINHALGSSLMIYAQQFAGGSDTAYLKATTKIGKTTLYGLYNYTWQDKMTFDGQELNLVVKQQLTDNLSVAVKGGFGYRDNKTVANTTATDARLFVTYAF
jgi:hypothetical protein